MVSIHPKETPSLAMAKKNLIIKDLAPKDPPAGWDKMVAGGLHFLTGNRDSINRLTQAVGFKYSYNEKKDLINHPTCTVLLSPEGKVSSYTIGNEFPTRVVETNLALASKNQIGEKADQSMMFGCIMLDPATGKYRVVIENVLRLSGLITVIILAFSIYSMNLKSKREELLRRDKSGLGASS
jgi:protein SCO1